MTDGTAMRRAVKAARIGLIALVVILTATVSARADFAGIRPSGHSKVRTRLDPPDYWLVGVALDRASGPERLDDDRALEEQFIGVSATYHRAWFGANIKLVAAPRSHAPRTPATLVTGIRIATRAFGRHFTYGVNVQGEANLASHYWIFHVSPLEIGGDLYVHRGLHIQLFAGVRYALEGDSIKSFLIDPNGFPSDVFTDRLNQRLDNPWEGFVSLVLARKID